MTNTLYYGDNLEVLRRYVKDESVDLIYLDPPFNSNATYNVLFAEKDGSKAASQIKAFDDTWHWNLDAETAYIELVERGGQVADAMRAFRTLLGDNDMMAYLAMMAPRLVELRRVLKPTGSIYLHCDPTASHYLKLIMDAVFGIQNYRNEIVWKRVHTVKGNFGQGSRLFGQNTDSIIFFSKMDSYLFNPVFKEYSKDYIQKFFRFTDHNGRRFRLISMIGPGGASKGNPQYEFLGVTRYWRYSRERMNKLFEEGMIVQTKEGAVPQRKLFLDEGFGVSIQSLWEDIQALSASSSERLGYPTQKPVALLERIIKASSNEGDVVLDPFCGCGTAIDAAQRLNRRWIGIDITHLAITLIKHRLRTTYGDDLKFDIVGEPVDLASAQMLAETDPYQFQFWSLGLVGARPAEQKKGADRGIDGRIYFHDEKGGKTKQVIISVKAGKVQVSYIRDLRGVLDREKAEIGVLIAMNPPTRDMEREAVSAGFYDSPWGTRHPRIQILTIEQLLDNRKIDYPGRGIADSTFKEPQKVRKTDMKQGEMF